MSKGQAQLKAIVDSDRGAQAKLARELSVASPVITRWVQGRQKPITRFRAELERLHGIPLLSWDQPAEPEAPTTQAPAA